MLRRISRREHAFTFVEVMGAAMLVAVFLAGAFYGNSQGLNMLRASRETAIASKVLQERMEVLRGTNWSEITDATSVQSIYATGTNADAGLAPVAETVTISAWPTPATSIQVTRSTSGAATIVSDNPDLVDGATAVLVTTRVSWTGVGARTRTRETSTVMANGGLGL